MAFPTSKKTFSQLVDGTTYMEGVNVNVAYGEVEAIETLIGALGRAQSYSDSLKNLLLSYKQGCKVDWKTVADLFVRAGEITIPDAAGNAAFRRNTADLIVTWADLDTGAEAVSTTYYVYAVADATGTTFTVKISTSASAPLGATYYKRLGSFYNNAAGDIDQYKFANDGILLDYQKVIVSLKLYDSGWFAISANTNYSFTHDLKTTKVIAQIMSSNGAPGSTIATYPRQEHQASRDGILTYGLSTTQISLRAMTLAADIWDGSAWVTPTYARIIVLALE